MKSRCCFILALLLAFTALALVQTARHELALAIRSGSKQFLFEQFVQRGTFLLYSGWVFAFGSAELLWKSYQIGDPESPWPVLMLLGFVVYVGVVP